VDNELVDEILRGIGLEHIGNEETDQDLFHIVGNAQDRSIQACLLNRGKN